MALSEPTPDTFAALLTGQAGRRPEAIVLREKRRGIWHGTSWRALADEAHALAAALAARGIGRSDHVVMIGENRPGLFAAMAAAHRIGAVAVPLFPDASVEEVAQQIVACTAKVIFAENQEQVDKMLRILPRCPSVQMIVHDDDRGMRHYAQTGLFAHRALVEEGRKTGHAAGPQPAGDDPAFVFFTSATAGSAKAVAFSHRAMIDRARAVTGADGLSESDTTLAFLPPGWMCQVLFSYALAMVSGLCICCPESSDTLLEDLREIAPTTLLMTPRMLDAILSRVTYRIEDTGGMSLTLYRRALANAERVEAGRLSGVAPGLGDRLSATLDSLLVMGPLRDSLGLSRVRSAYSTGDALDPGMLRVFRAMGINLKQLYGTTETGFAVAMHRDGAVWPDTVGTPLDGVELSFSADREIRVRAKGMMSGYLGAAPVADGWIETGDLGHLDARGQLHVEGRLDSVARLAGGQTFAPRALESRIRVSPYVRECVVIGDGRESVCALIDIDTLAVGKWADGHEIPYMGHVDLASQDQVYALISAWISEVNEALAADPAQAALQVRRFALLPKELSAEDGLLTRTGKLRRTAVTLRFATLIDALYAGSSVAMVDHADPEGARGADTEVLGLKIGDARVVGGGNGRRAA